MKEIRWRLHLAAAPEDVWRLLATDAGRSRFWAESTTERDGAIEFVFANGQRYTGRVLASDVPRTFELDYFGTPARFTLEGDGEGGTDLALVQQVEDEWHVEVNAGWVSVLMALKAAADHGVDLRNHDARRTWSQGYCES